MSINKYRGICYICGAIVEAHNGLYGHGGTTCGESRYIGDTLVCPATAAAVQERYDSLVARPETPRTPKRLFTDDGMCVKCNGTGEYWKSDHRGGYFNDGCYPCGGTGKKQSHSTTQTEAK